VLKCKECSVSISHPKRSFCSETCRVKYFNNKTAKRNKEARGQLRCAVCNKKILNSKKSTVMYCSQECRSKRNNLERRNKTKNKLAGKVCAKCGVEINAIRSRRKYCSQKCKDAARSRAQLRWKRVLTLYNLTQTEWEDILQLQGGVCAICQKESRTWHTDHNHSCCPGKVSCGKCVRGILCNKCNQAIGLLHENIESLERAARYLS
jgi:predicted nucleic acid-binding Zn ribbon protein